MFWIGIYPSTFLRPMDASVRHLLTIVEARGGEVARIALAGNEEPDPDGAADASGE